MSSPAYQLVHSQWAQCGGPGPSFLSKVVLSTTWGISNLEPKESGINPDAALLGLGPIGKRVQGAWALRLETVLSVIH